MKFFKTTLLLLTLISLSSGCGYKYYLNSGVNDYNNLYYADALTELNKSLAKNADSYDANKAIAMTYMKLHDYGKAAEYYKLAVEYPQSTAEDKFNFAKSLMSINEHEKAEEIFNSYLKLQPEDDLARSLRQSCQYISLLVDDTAKYDIEVLPMFNTISMFSPVKYKDGIAFTSEQTANNNQNPWTGNSYYDINYVTREGDNWSEPTLLEGEVNKKFHDGPISFDKDEKFAIFTRSYSIDEKTKGKDENNYNNLFLYSTEFVDTGWVNIEELPFNSINYTCMHPSLSSDGKLLYFASDMPDGYGGTDLYKSKFVDGEWTKPINLGDKINTKGNESFPYYESDTLLYFSSDGHPSLGGLDIFSSSGSKGVWEAPKNLNYPINTVLDDFGYLPAGEDSVGFFSSKRNGIDQIFTVVEKYEGVVTINGLVVDAETGKPLEGAVVKLIDKDTGEVIEELVTGADGKFTMDLAAEKNYRIESTKDGYLLESYERSTMQQYLDEEEEITLNMRKALVTDPNAAYTLDNDGLFEIPNIFYDLDDYRIRPDAAFELEKIYKLLVDNPKMTIELNSHTDSRAVEGYNMRLSVNRAKAARKFLIRKGIKASRISYKGFGESQLVNECDNDTECSEEKHQENRRTEFIITDLGGNK